MGLPDPYGSHSYKKTSLRCIVMKSEIIGKVLKMHLIRL